MKITDIELYYLALPQITDAADGTQDTLLVHIGTDTGIEGFGECDASPLVSMAAYCCPPSHSNIVNIRETILGETVETPEDIRRIQAKVWARGLDIEQIHHAYSGADIALWDILGKKRGLPVYRLLGDQKAYPKRPYGSVLFGDTPQQTRERARSLAAAGFKAAKFGWGPMGKGTLDDDVALVAAARGGMGPDNEVMIDAGCVWGHDLQNALLRAQRFAEYNITWLEEPFHPHAIEAYGRLAKQSPVRLAGGEGSNTVRFAEDLLTHGGVSFIQIDAGRIGGITPAYDVRRLAEKHGAVYVNHTFKSKLSLSAAMHVFAGVERFVYLEYPQSGSPLAENLCKPCLQPGPDGSVRLTEAPGLGVEIDANTVKRFRRPVRIEVDGKTLLEA
ncbi:MAG: mandelate racemase/muconate lactonizing enzyme family protein [Phycisphaerae bacterium]